MVKNPQTGTIVLFLYGLSSATIAPLPLGLAAALLLLFVGVEYRVAADPVVPLAVLGSRGALLSCAAQLGLMAARWCVLFYAPVFALAVWGWRPAAAGSVLVPTNLGFGLGGLAAVATIDAQLRRRRDEDAPPPIRPRARRSAAISATNSGVAMRSRTSGT